jgi:hypothetical protein
MIEIEVRRVEKIAVKYLKVEAGVRYWEDGTVNGVEDADGSLIPCRAGDCWCPVIDLETGIIQGWPTPTTASVHYKVADSGRYVLLDADRNEVKAIDGYVPPILSPGGDGYGDYVIMDIDGAGKIAKWRVDLDGFEGEER